MEKIKISVVVPAYNVARYLRECLDSLANQTIIKEMEIIMVNDGATDETGQIMDAYAHTYANFHVHHNENGGLGYARNYGADLARGDYLAFVDSDDYVTKDAYEKMLAMAERNQTDMVIGNVMRFNSTKAYPSSLHQYVFLETKEKTHVFDAFELLYDTTAWNKLIRISFWRKYQFAFPERMLYEDIPVTIPAHILATSVSVMTEVVYFWRSRDGDDKSITQQRTEKENLIDRVKAINLVYDFLAQQHISTDIKKHFDYKNLTHDFKIYINTLPDGDIDYQLAMMKIIRPVLDRMDQDVFNRLYIIDRMRYRFIREMNVRKLKWLQKFARIKHNLAKRMKT
ncbi:MAG: glycosyltransferase [Defluviitaleaceae bacterium]|nr:glycosyltransferase [Defluviitaleaceae bacterium]